LRSVIERAQREDVRPLGAALQRVQDALDVRAHFAPTADACVSARTTSSSPDLRLSHALSEAIDWPDPQMGQACAVGITTSHATQTNARAIEMAFM